MNVIAEQINDMIITKNLGINIPAALEKRDRKLKPPSLRKDNWSIQAKADFAMYEKAKNAEKNN